MTLKERWKAKESKIGKFLKREITILASITGAIAEGALYFEQLPTGVPDWVPHVIVACAMFTRIVGKLTVENKDKQNE